MGSSERTRSATWRRPRMRGGGDGMLAIYHSTAGQPPGPPRGRSCGPASVRGGEGLLDGCEVRVHLGVALAELLDALDGAHHRRVVAVAEGASELREAAAEPLPAEVHGHVPRERDALVAILAEELRVRQPKMTADRA